MTDNLLTLLLAHLLADFPLQTSWLYRLKCKGQVGLVLHAAVHAAVTASLHRAPLHDWQVWVFVGLVHWLIDWLKLRMDARCRAPGFVLDQAAHVGSLALTVTLVPGAAVVAIPSHWLFMAILAAMIPAVTMFMWVCADDLSREKKVPCPFCGAIIRWTQQRMMSVSKYSGLLVIGTLIGLGLDWGLG